MPPGLSPRLAAIVDGPPIEPHTRVLEIGCGPGTAARAVAARLIDGHILAIDRSAKAISQAPTAAASEIASGRMSVRQVAVEELVLEPGERRFDVAFAARVGVLDGRHAQAEKEALERIATALRPEGRPFIDGREVSVPATQRP